MDEQTKKLVDIAGGLLYKRHNNRIEVLLVHRSGNSKTWILPQVEVSPQENFAPAVARQIEETTTVPTRELEYLGVATYPKHRLHCYFAEAPATAVPKPSRLEVDGAKFFPLTTAKTLVDKRSVLLLQSLESMLGFYRDSA